MFSFSTLDNDRETGRIVPCFVNYCVLQPRPHLFLSYFIWLGSVISVDTDQFRSMEGRSLKAFLCETAVFATFPSLKAVFEAFPFSVATMRPNRWRCEGIFALQVRAGLIEYADFLLRMSEFGLVKNPDIEDPNKTRCGVRKTIKPLKNHSDD